MGANTKKIFGKNLRANRERKGFSQEKLAYLSELHRTYISDVERGERNISLENIQKIANALQIKIIDLFKGIDVKKTSNKQNLKLKTAQKKTVTYSLPEGPLNPKNAFMSRHSCLKVFTNRNLVYLNCHIRGDIFSLLIVL